MREHPPFLRSGITTDAGMIDYKKHEEKKLKKV